MQAAPRKRSFASSATTWRPSPRRSRASCPRNASALSKDPDVQSAAITILHCELGYKGEPFVAEALHEIAHTFAAASLRITRFSKTLT